MDFGLLMPLIGDIGDDLMPDKIDHPDFVSLAL